MISEPSAEGDISSYSGVGEGDALHHQGNLGKESNGDQEAARTSEHGDDDDPSALDDDEYDDECCLFIGDLARGLNEEQLREPFEPFGVASVEIKRDRVTGYSLGYGFVQFKTRQEAGNAKKNLHRTVVGGRAIRIGWAQKNTNLFVGDLDPSITSEQLREVFRRFGPIYEEETFVKHRNYGFVRFKHRKHAEVAKREMDEKVLGNRAIRIGWGDANYQRHCVHIQFDPAESENLTESDVIAKFEEFGTVMSVNLPRNQGILRGFGFIYYDDTDGGEDSAAAAISALNSLEICGVRVQCNFGKKPNAKKRKTRTGGKRSPGGSPGSGSPNVGRGGGGGRQQPLYPVQVMMPVGPQGTWQPVQYMMTAQQAQQFYNSMQYNAQPQHSSPPPTRESPPQQSMMPPYYYYRGKDQKAADEDSMLGGVSLGGQGGGSGRQQQQQQQHYVPQPTYYTSSSYPAQRQLPQQQVPQQRSPRRVYTYLPKMQASPTGQGGLYPHPQQPQGPAQTLLHQPPFDN